MVTPPTPPDHPDRGSDLLPARPVWLTEDDFFDLLAGGQQMQAVRQKIIDAWDIAPADPAEAVVKATAEYFGDDGRYAVPIGQMADAVLGALGLEAPDA